MPMMPRQGIAGASLRVASETLPAASPSTSMNRSKAAASTASVSRSARFRPETACTAQRAWSSISSRRTRSSGCPIERYCAAQHTATKVRAQESRCVEVNLVAEQFRELLLDRHESQPDPRSRLELDEYIHVAFGAEVLAKRGAEEGEPPDGGAAAKLCEPLAIDLKCQCCHPNACYHDGCKGLPSSRGRPLHAAAVLAADLVEGVSDLAEGAG